MVALDAVDLAADEQRLAVGLVDPRDFLDGHAVERRLHELQRVDMRRDAAQRLAAAARDGQRRAVEHGTKGHEGRVGGERVLFADADDGRVVHLALMRDDSRALRARRTRRDDRHVEAARGEHAPREAAGEACKLAAEVVIELEDDSLHRCRFKLVKGVLARNGLPLKELLKERRPIEGLMIDLALLRSDDQPQSSRRLASVRH